MAYIRLPNNSYFPVADGESPKQALEEARKAYPKAFMEAGELESKQGFLPAAGEAFKDFKTKSLMGLGELTGNATLQKMAQDASEADEKAKQEGKHDFLPTEEEDIEAARSKGLMPLAGAYARKYISEPLGGIAGRYGAPMAAGAGAAGIAALAAPGAAVTGAGVLGAGLLAKGVTSLTDLPAEVGENIQRQIDVGAPIDSTKATAYGLAQAALAGFGIPGMGKLAAPVQKLFGKEANALAADVISGTLTKEQALAQLSGTLKNVITNTGSAAVTGAGLMVGTEAARRASANQDVTSPEALEEYKQNLVGAAELAPLFGVLHGVPKRGKDKKLIDQASQKFEVTKGREERARQDAEAAVTADLAQAEEFRKRQGETGDLFGEQFRTEGPAKGKQAFGKMEGDVSPLPGNELFTNKFAQFVDGNPAERVTKVEDIKPVENERALRYPSTEEVKSPQEVMSQERNLKQYVTGLRDQVSAAAAKADIKTLGELTPQLKQAEAAYTAASKEYAALDIPEVKFQQLTEQIETKTKQLQKAGGAQGDFAKIEKLTSDIQKLQAELEKVKPPSGPDLFEVEKEVVAKGKAEAAEALAQGQQDFLAQVGKPETRIDARQRQTLERYNDNVRQLDEAYAANADKRLIDKLVDSVQADAAEHAAIVAKTSDTRTLAQEEASQQRIARITRAIAEAEAKQDTASVAGLRNQLAKAIVESARPDVSTKRNRALEDQQAAIEELRSQVEDLKTKRYLGEGARDMSTAASLKAGLERKANETIGRYVEAAIRDVNAVREQNNVKKLTQTEAIRLAMDVRGHLENAVRNLNVSALRMPKESTVSTLEKQLAQIKRKHHKGEYVGPKRAEEFTLRPEFDTLRAQQEQGKKVEGGTPFETEARKVEREELEAKAEKEKTKERAYADVGNPDQRNLFGEKDLEPIATTRATPENFMRLLRSGVVQELRSKLADIETIVPKVSKKEIAKAQQEKTARETFANEVAVEKAIQAANKLRKAVANTEKYIQELNDKLSAVRMAVPTVKNPEAKPSPELVRQRKAVLKEREAIAKQFEKKGTSLNKQLVEQKERLRAADARVDALENGPQRVKRLTNEIKAEEDKANPDAQRLAKLRDQLEVAENNTADKPFESFASQLKKQRRVVEEVAAAEELAGNLRHNATQLWVMSGRAKIELEKAVTEQKEIAAKLKDARETKRSLEKDNETNLQQAEGRPDFAEEFINKTKVQIAKVNKEIDGLKKKDVAAQEKVRVAEESVRELREEAPKRMVEIDSYNKRANELLETNVKTERAILASMERQYARMTKASPEARAFAKQMSDLRKQNAVSTRELSISREKRNKETRDLEAAQAESDKLFRVTRQEIVGSNRKTQNVRELKKKDALELQLGKERDKDTPDSSKIIRLERQLEALQTTQEITRKQVTREVPLATEALKRETRLDEQVREREEAIARGEARKETGGVSRTKLADALKEESVVSADLKEVRRQLGNFTNVIVGLEKSAKSTTKPEAKAAFEKRLADARKNLEAKGLLEKEKALVDKLTELKKVGVGVERTLEVLGNKPEREQRTNVKTSALTPEQVAARKAAAKQRKLLNEDFEHYLRTEDRAKRENPTQAEYKGPSGGVYRASPATEQRLDASESKRITDDIEKNLPKDIKVKSVESIANLPQEVKKALALDGFVEGSAQANTLRGFVTPTGEVYIIRGNHATAKELQVTYAHEIIGHAGVDRILGPEGVRELVKRIQAHGGAMELAKKLGVEKEVQGAINDYAMSVQKLTESKAPTEQIKKAIDDMESQVVRELIAYTAEKRIDENFKQKAGRWLKELVGAVRAALRKRGFAELAEVSTADIYHILRQSQRNFNRGEMGAFRESNGQMAYRNKPVYAEGFDAGMAASTNKVIAQQKEFRDRIQGSVSGMSMMTRFVDRFAPLEYIARTMKDKLEGVQMMYNNRLYDQRNNMLAEIATHGSVGYTKGNDGSYQYKSRGGPSLKDVFESAAKAKDKVGNGQATTDFFGMYIAMERAASDKKGLAEGLNKLSLDGKVSIAEATRILDFGRGDKNFQEARKQYREYNNGLVDLMVETGRLSKEESVALKNGDYVPYYRENAKGELWDTEHNIKIGDLKTQAYLKELMGGDSAIVNFETGALQNTYMLTDMAMSNIATKNTAYTLNKLGIAEIRKGDGPAAPNVMRFYENGKQMHAIVETKGAYVGMEAKLDKMRADGKANTTEFKLLREKAEASRMSETVYGDIPAELIVKGMEGVTTATPLAVAMMRGPANLLRKAVTRNPVYAARVALKDSISGWVTSGADVTPVLGVLGNLKKSWKGGSPEVRSLQEQGIIGGHVFAGTMSDMRTVAQQIAQGKTGWEKLWAGADRLAITADEASRVTLYNGFIKKGMSPMEATLATLESQNFTKHGFSPSVRMLSTMIPFFNAQITGLNTFISNLSGKSLFEDKLGVKANMLKRGAMIAGTTMIYSALMQNTDAYKNATWQDKLNYWFIPLPFFDEPIRVPIPFEAGTLFKAIPEALFNLSLTDAKAKDVLPAVAKLVLGTVPGMSNLGLPQGIKPIIEAATNTNLFTMNPIQSQRQLAREAGHRANTNTTEASKMFGEALGVSPIMIDHFVNAYTSSAGIALLSMFNPMLRDVGTPESKSSQLPLIGGFFQPTDGNGLIDKAYADMAQIERINRTFKDLEEQNPEKAEQYLDKNIQQLDLASAAGKFKKDMGDLNKEERLIQSDRSMTREQKRKELDEIKQMKIEMAKEFMSISRE